MHVQPDDVRSDMHITSASHWTSLATIKLGAPRKVGYQKLDVLKAANRSDSLRHTGCVWELA